MNENRISFFNKVVSDAEFEGQIPRQLAAGYLSPDKPQPQRLWLVLKTQFCYNYEKQMDSWKGMEMGKERLVAFTDAVIAIVITILVLELELPAAPTLEALWEIREGFFAYAVSFFWIGATWINLHNQWHRARRITTRVVWHTVLMLFFISLIPYVTRFAGSNLMSMFALGVYWAVSLLATINIMAQGYALGYYNRDDSVFLASARVLNHWMWVDLGVNIAGFVLALVLNYPPIVMIVICVAAIIPSVVIRHLNREYEE